MSDRFTEEDIIVAVSRLTRGQLHEFIDRELVRPIQAPSGYVFAQVDVARLELLCDLSVDLELDEIALEMVIGLIDQVHELRRDLNSVLRAIEAQPPELRARLAAALVRE